MTRTNFIENVTEWNELTEFCRDMDCDVCDDIIDADDLDSYVNTDLRDAVANGEDWEDIYRWLDGISTGYEYYRVDGSFDYEPMDNGHDFDSYKNDVIEWMDDNGLWDEEDDEEYDEEGYDDDEAGFYPPDEPEEEPPVEEEDFSVSDLMSMCGSELITIRQVAERHKKELDDNMVALFAV